MKLCLNLNPDTIDINNGIGQVVLSQWRHLREYGIDVVSNPNGANVLAAHVSRPGEWPRIDILHTHGLYWNDVEHLPYVGWHNTANKNIVENARKAKLITVPSSWVATPFMRDMRIIPRIIGHGVNVSEWKPEKNKGYVLYNKGRESDVCKALPAYELAKRKAQVVSTFYPAEHRVSLDNFKVTGTVSHEQMKRLIQSADVYLATTIETFGIGTIEALAAGVPVLGFSWGGTRDIISHKVDGYLVEPNDLDGLEKGLEYIRDNRYAMSQAALEKAKKYDWLKIMQIYADLYQEVDNLDINYGISVIVTNYNYGQWVCDAVNSVLAQTYPVDKVIVVDDGSTDASRDILTKTYSNNEKVELVFQENRGVAAARNRGISIAKTDFVVCLDADDKLSPRYVEVLLPAISEQNDIGIVYPGLGFMNEKGELAFASQWPPEFAWDIQSTYSVPPSNVIPSGSMFRKSMWERAGGYKQQYAPGEDAEFWTRGLSVGFTAKKVTNEPLFLYRGHEGSASRTKKYVPLDGLPWLKDKLFPMGAPVKNRPPTIFSYANPQVSVIVPVGRGHGKFVPGIIECMLAQTFRLWEIIIIDDTVNEKGESEFERLNLKAYPFARIIKNTGKHGAGVARNIGIDAANAPLVLFLDADDYLLHNAIDKMVDHFLDTEKYIYTDYFLIGKDRQEKHESKEYSQTDWVINDPIAVKQGIVFGMMQHSTTVLMPTEWAQAVKFDEVMDSWEDWEFFIRCAVRGYCGSRLPEALLVYQLDTGARRLKVLGADGKPNENGVTILREMRNRYESYITGGKEMSPCCGGSAADTIIRAKTAISGELYGGVSMIASSTGGRPLARMEYTGANFGAIGFVVNNRTYRGGQDPSSKYVDVHPEDVKDLEGTGRWKLIRPAVAPSPVQVQAPLVDNQPTEQEQMAMAQRALESAKRQFEQAEAGIKEEKPIVIPEPTPIIEGTVSSVEDILKEEETIVVKSKGGRPKKNA